MLSHLTISTLSNVWHITHFIDIQLLCDNRYLVLLKLMIKSKVKGIDNHACSNFFMQNETRFGPMKNQKFKIAFCHFASRNLKRHLS